MATWSGWKLAAWSQELQTCWAVDVHGVLSTLSKDVQVLPSGHFFGFFQPQLISNVLKAFHFIHQMLGRQISKLYNRCAEIGTPTVFENFVILTMNCWQVVLGETLDDCGRIVGSVKRYKLADSRNYFKITLHLKEHYYEMTYLCPARDRESRGLIFPKLKDLIPDL